MKIFVVFSCLFVYSHAALLTQDQFLKCVSAFGKNPGAKVANAFISQAQKNGGISSTREAIMAVAQMSWESAGFTAKEEWACCCGKWNKNPCETYDKKGCPPGKQYFGRGYIQLTHCYNYKAAANALGNQNIVNNPDIVARDENVAMATALWYWKTKVHNAAGVQQGRFGAATKAINGALECTGNKKNVAKQRWQKLNECLNKANLKNLAIQEGGCYN